MSEHGHLLLIPYLCSQSAPESAMPLTPEQQAVLYELTAINICIDDMSVCCFHGLQLVA